MNFLKNNQIKNLIEYTCFRGVIGFFKMLPYSFTVRFMAYFLLFGGKVLRIRRALVIKQISAVFPEKSQKEINQLADRMYFELGKSVCEIFIASDQQIFNQMNCEGLDHLQKCLEAKKGIIFVSAHFGNWEIGAKYLASKSGKIYAVVKEQRNKLFDQYVNQSRLASGVHVLSMKNAIKPIINALNNKETVGFLVDQYAGRHGVDLPFLGLPTKVFTSVAKLSLKTKAPILIAFDVRKGFYKHHCFICEPIYTDNIELNEENILDLTQKINYHIEEFIRKYPEMWFWVHRRWRKL